MMRVQGFGDLAHFMLRSTQMAALKSSAAAASTELTTGIMADSVRQLGASNGVLASIEGALARLGAYHTTGQAAELRVGTALTALESFDDRAGTLAADLVNATATANAVTIDALGRESAQAFEGAVALLNTTVAGRSLFAGTAENGPALIPADQILDLLEIATASSLTAADVEAAVTAWFDDPAGFEAQAFLGNTARAPVALSDQDQVDLSVTPLDPGIRDTLKGLAMAALLDRGAMAGSVTERRNLAVRAGQQVIESGAKRIAAAAELGVTAAQIDRAQTRNSAERSGLEIARARLISVDPLQSATRLEQTQTQLETLYGVTARLSRMTLMDFLR